MRTGKRGWRKITHPRTGLWLKLAKKGSGRKSVTYDEAVEAALCYGWIDGQKKPFDGEFWLEKFTPTGAKEHLGKKKP